ncbi:DinB family protein [Thermogemmatispora tikiterensis]|uniref:DinB-like domain-containing protein n=1 Tax=Thermogemmatispora tikiterensis TaxID=1825093 RepID=A0A328VCN2_9CHLR|nr:DinB family protein [Thermogemmatispora tikiterensis]RAQ95367.1 hypothetical protein A4R35_07450 [Thermogemmatispora tikiterensis]
MNASDVLKYGHLTVMKTLEGFPESAREQSGACGVWSVKDIIAHLASYELVLVDVLVSFLEDDPTPYLGRFTELGPQFNEAEVAMRKASSFAEVLQEYVSTHERTMELITRIPAETCRQTGTLPWYGDPYSLDDLIVYMYYGHKREHSAQIAAFRDHLR